MNFFQKLFSKKDKSSTNSNESNNRREPGFQGISTHDHFDKKFKEEPIDTPMVEGAIKMVQSFYLDTKSEPLVDSPINHPRNLDQIIDEGFGFKLYCSAFDMEEQHALMFLALSFNEYMIKNYDFVLYRDTEPEHPMRTMTLKFNKEGAVLSLYPIEYAAKVLNHLETFEELYEKVKSNLNSLPTGEEVYKKLMNS